MDWLYRFASNEKYPEPIEEIDALCTLDDNGEHAFLMLSDRLTPPMCKASRGDVVGLCTSTNGRLNLHGTATIKGPCIRGTTPLPVEPLYGIRSDRLFVPLQDMVRLPSDLLNDTILAKPDQQKFLNGQSFVKRLTTEKRSTLQRSLLDKGADVCVVAKFDFPKVCLPKSVSRFVVVGLDPTAGTWTSKMSEGPKAMPSFALVWNGENFQPDEESLRWHITNAELWTQVQSRNASLTCIDGPCGTNGPRLLPDQSGWNPKASNGIRDGELALSHQGINLFWTTQNTVLKFEGASRWIARSLILFSEKPDLQKIETHPHGAFTYLWRMFGYAGTPPKKSKDPGRQARLAILRAFIPELLEDMVPDHDALDAACAALVAGLHQFGLTTAFGTLSSGGKIWMPDLDKISPYAHM